MLKTKEEIKKRKKKIIKDALNFAKNNNNDFIGFLQDTIEELKDARKDVPKGLRKMIRSLEKKPLLLTKATIDDKKWALEFYRDYEIYDTKDDLVLINQMLVNTRRIDPNYEEIQDWQLIEIEQESKIETIDVKKKKLDKMRLIEEEDK